MSCSQDNKDEPLPPGIDPSWNDAIPAIVIEDPTELGHSTP